MGVGRAVTGDRPGRHVGRRAAAALVVASLVAGGAGRAAATEDSTAQSDLRIGVLALADAISAVGRTPELAEALPFTRTSPADLLRLDDVFGGDLEDVLADPDVDLDTAIAAVPGVVDVAVDDDTHRVTFGYNQTVTAPLLLAHDDGTLRLGSNEGAGDVTVTLATPVDGTPFVVEIDEDQEDPLLRFALVSQPELELSIDVSTPAIAPFGAREGFTEVSVEAGRYTIDRTTELTLRDPDGRSWLTLEDLRYSTLVDLYRVVRADDDIDIAFDLALPDETFVHGDGATDADRLGTLTLGEVEADEVWPSPADAAREYGAALHALTSLPLARAVTGVAEYTGTALVLQKAAAVGFPNLGGGTTDLFAPADELLDLLATSAVAEIRCGLTPENPPRGVPAPGDAVYCAAVTADGLGDVTEATWSVRDEGEIDDASDTEAVGAEPTATVAITGSDGEPDVQVALTFADGTELTARTLPRSVQDVVARIVELGDATGRTAASSATVNLDDDRLDIAVDIEAQTAVAELPVGNPTTLGALVGLTGLRGGAAGGRAEASLADASFDVGFGIPLSEPTDPGEQRSIHLLPADGSLFEVGSVGVDAPTGLTQLTGRIGFLGVDVDVTSLSLGRADDLAPLSSLDTTDGVEPIPVDELLTDDGSLAPGHVTATNQLVAGIAFDAVEQAMPGGVFATGGTEGLSGSADVDWGVSGLPNASFDAGYDGLRVFDPVPAVFLSGTVEVTPVVDDDDIVEIAVDPATDLYEELGVAEPASGGPAVEVMRRLLATGASCQNVELVDDHTLTCEGLAPDGVSAYDDGAAVEVIVLGDPFALRDGLIDGLATSLNEFERLDADNVVDDPVDDQYASTLPLVDLKPAQLAVEREVLGNGLGSLLDAATADERGPPPAGGASVSSAQELAAAVPGLFDGGTLAFEVATGSLGVQIEVAAPDGTTLEAPLRFTEDSVGQVVSDATVVVEVASTTVIATVVDVDTARPTGSDGAESTSTASLADGVDPSMSFHAGVTELTADEVDADLDVTVETSWDVDERVLTTPARTGEGASAHITVDGRDDLLYTAEPYESSGGGGAAQPAPDPMQVAFLAEGLDGLAAALGAALDGNSPAVTGPDGAPVSAPLIGADLDAGADVAGVLTDLTSALRDELQALTEETAEELEDALGGADGAIASAIDDADGVSLDGSVDADVQCDDCTPPCDPDDPDPQDCGDDGPTVWDAITVHFVLEGEEKEGEVPFDIGLAGINVRSDQVVETTTSWTLPVQLELVRGVGPQVTVADDDVLTLEVDAALPAEPGDEVSEIPWVGDDCPEGAAGCLPAILGYLPGLLTAEDADSAGVATSVVVDLPDGSHDLFDLFDGLDDVSTAFDDADHDEEGISLDFETFASEYGSFDLTGTINVPWTAADGFGEVTYDDVKLDVGEVIATIATPFAVVDPYLTPVRDFIDVVRTPLPLISDISEMGGGDPISLLSIVEDFQGANPRLDMVIRVASYVETAAAVIGAAAPFADQDVPLEDLADAGALITIDPGEVELASSCTETVRTRTTSGAGTTRARSSQPCPDTEAAPDEGVRNQSSGENRRGGRTTKTSVAESTRGITGSSPGFSLPFLADPDQIVDVLTGEGEASYFRMDFGTLEAEVAYSQKFGPIMVGPVPIVPFIGGSVTLSGRMAAGFDSFPQTLATRSVPDGDVVALVAELESFDGGDIMREGFYLDDLDADGVDVPEVQLVTTIEAGAGVSIGIVTAGLKGGLTLAINLDMNDPNDDGRIRIAEIRESFAGDLGCLFDVSATLEAYLQVFLEIELWLTTKSWAWDIVRLGPYTLFEYGCEDAVPNLVVEESGDLALTSGARAPSGRDASAFDDIAEDYEVRQFDTEGGAAGGGTTTYEISAINRVQRVTVTPAVAPAEGYTVTIYESAVALSTTVRQTYLIDDLADLRFLADGNATRDDSFAFLLGETFDAEGNLQSTRFTTAVSVNGHGGKDVVTTGDGGDVVTGGGADDALSAGFGDDVVLGGGGDDTVDGGAGQDDLDGGIGHDRLEGGPGPDRLVGAAGDDALVGGPGRDVRALLLEGQDVPPVATQVDRGFDSGDVLVGGAGADSVDGGDGSDVVVGGGAASLTGAAMSTLFVPGTRSVNVLNEQTRDIDEQTVVIRTAAVPTAAAIDGLCASGAIAEAGAGAADLVTGGPEDDVVIGGDGPDELDGGGGSDWLCGRHGADLVSGDGGATDLDAGDDIIRGGRGADVVDAGAGADVAYGDDVELVRDGLVVLDGTLGDGATGDGDDYVHGGDGDDVVSGGDGSDLLRGGDGDDGVYGEGGESADVGGEAPSVADRLVACSPVTRIVRGGVDLNGDLVAASEALEGIVADDGQLAGLRVVGGVVQAPAGGTYTGLIGEEVVVVDGLVDLDRDGDVDDDADDTGTVQLGSMGATTDTNPAGDCILGEDGADDLRGGAGSDHVAGGAAGDLVTGGDGNDLLLGDDGADMVLGGAHHDVVVGGTGDDHLVGGEGDDRLRGNEGADDLTGGSDQAGETDGQDVLLGGRGQDVLAAENALLVSSAIAEAAEGAPWEEHAPVAVRVDDTDLLFEDSAVSCGGATATRWVTLLQGGDEERVPVASPGEAPAYDELYGGYGCDWVLGQAGDDVVRGGQDDDVVEGGPGADVGQGDAGDDVVIGGSSVDTAGTDEGAGRIVDGRSGEGVADDVDTLLGDGGPDGGDGDDLLAGDNATPRFATGSWRIHLWDLQLDAVTVAELGEGVFGDDAVDGGGGADRIFGQSGDDDVDGGGDDDYVEGGAGDDTIDGGAGDDDLLGGSSSTAGIPMGTDGDRLQESLDPTDPSELVDTSASGLRDGADTIAGGSGEDVVLGDSGRITRPGGTLTSSTSARPVRGVAMADVAVGDTSASDVLAGGAGDDVLYGQLDDGTAALGSGDELHGGDGLDTMLGDLGVVVPTPAAELGSANTLGLRREIIAEPVYTAGSLIGVAHVPAALALLGGNDVAYGDADDDVIRLGAGADLANGGAGDDTVFGGAGNDALWGGLDHDRIFGGRGADELDLKARAGDPAAYASVAGVEDTDNKVSTGNGSDLIYGGWGPDELQADSGSAGPQPESDYLVDWIGAHNLYYVCGGAYGAGRVIRQPSPDLRDLLVAVTRAHGGRDVGTTGTGAWYDLGLVQNADGNANSSPHPDNPGNHTCEAPG